MLKEFAYVYPLVGRVAIGEIVREENKSPRPVKHDYFSVTTQAKINGAWVAHPVQSKLMASDPEKKLGLFSVVAQLFGQFHQLIRDTLAFCRRRFLAFILQNFVNGGNRHTYWRTILFVPHNGEFATMRKVRQNLALGHGV